VGGGNRLPPFAYEDIHSYFITAEGYMHNNQDNFKFLSHVHRNVAKALYKDNKDVVLATALLDIMSQKLPMKDIKLIAKIHSVYIPYRVRHKEMSDYFRGHQCNSCKTHLSAFVVCRKNSEYCKKWYKNLDKKDKSELCTKKNSKVTLDALAKAKKAKKDKLRYKMKKAMDIEFPPLPPSSKLKETIISNWCSDSSAENFMEGGCAVCGQLVSLKYLSELSETKCDLGVLNRDNVSVTRLERFSPSDSIQEIKGPVLDSKCTKICKSCEDSLIKGLTPKYALADGLWLGNVPSQLQNLTFAEQTLISRVHHNKCIMRVSSGMHKMKANAIMFENPMPKIYQRLPPSIDDLDEVLAFIYTGPCRPMPEDLERTPLLVRRQKIAEALEWLKLNHVDYYDLDISYENLKEYPEKGSPVVVVYRNSETNKELEATSAYDDADEDGVDDGKCPFVVSGITGEELGMLGPKALVARATKHLMEDEGGVLAIGHADQPQSLYHNPRLYPMMFPHLFPYGLGGIGSTDINMSDMMHKRRLLMYHDKQFQMDSYFPLVAFNHEQIKSGTTGGFLLTEKHNFNNIAERLMNIDTTVLADLSKRLSKGERVRPETKEEKNCYALISDLDHVAGHVQGSITSKKYM
jgi:hypothetical protein